MLQCFKNIFFLRFYTKYDVLHQFIGRQRLLTTIQSLGEFYSFRLFSPGLYGAYYAVLDILIVLCGASDHIRGVLNAFCILYIQSHTTDGQNSEVQNNTIPYMVILL